MRIENWRPHCGERVGCRRNRINLSSAIGFVCYNDHVNTSMWDCGYRVSSINSAYEQVGM